MADNANLSTPAASDNQTQASSRAQSAASSFKSTSSNLPSTDTPATSTTVTETGTSQEEAEEWEPPKDGQVKTPITKPMKGCKPAPAKPLTSEEQTKYATVLAQVSQWETLPSTEKKNAPQAPVQDHERMWLTRDCLLRYLRATKWNTANAIKRLQSTLTWRREYGADTFTSDYISPENETGKQVIQGYDVEGRPCLYLNPAKQNTKMSDRQIHHLCYMLDRTVDMMPPGQESACLLINFKGAASGNVPSVGQARTVLTILQTHSPERLGKALIGELPWYVNTFFKLISAFIDPVTKEKMKFNEDMKQYVPAAQLWKAYQGGELNFEYDHAAYWPALAAETDKRRSAYRERWEKAGKRIGESEEYLRGGACPPLAEVERKVSGEKNPVGEKDADLATAGVAKMTV
ncbi:hypothetical protein B0A50_03741 [Salinomyces thailandicus]|uniref:CRAL-TRIO domain-containing protein n=1 Tax=Salinomyces thailandicus TaxID=706561 RepID=A0A4U0U2L2_9PEZI|nr:hypothetical protein B0A50_03741 [Salinomyces thailandica]